MIVDFISVVIPVYNKSKYIEQVIKNLKKELNHFKYELIIVNDGSIDADEDFFNKFKSDCIKVFNNKINMGKGYALRKGIRNSSGDLVFFWDADVEIETDFFQKVISEVSISKENFFYLGSKFHKDSKTNITMMRKIYSYMFYRIHNFILKTNIRDVQSGAKAFPGEDLRRFAKHSKVDSFSFDLEIVYYFKINNRIPIEVPINVSRSFDSTVSFIKGIKSVIDIFLIYQNVKDENFQ